MGTYKGNEGNLMQHWTLCEIVSLANAHYRALNYIDAYSMSPLAATRKDKDRVFSEVRNNLGTGLSVYEKAWASLAPPRSDAYPNSANFVQHLWRGDLSMLLCEKEPDIAAELEAWVKGLLQSGRLLRGDVHTGDWRDRFSKELPSPADAGLPGGALTLVSFDPYLVSNLTDPDPCNPGYIYPRDLDAIGQVLKNIDGSIVVQMSTYSIGGGQYHQEIITPLVDNHMGAYCFTRAAKTRTDGHMMSLVYTRGVNAELTRALKALGNRFDTWLRAQDP